MRYLAFITIIFASSYGFGAASAAGLSVDGMRIKCQQYKGATAQNTILILEYRTNELEEDSNETGPGVPGTMLIYSDYTGEKLYKSKNSDTPNSISYTNILEKVTSPARSIRVKVYLVGPQIFTFKGVDEAVELRAHIPVQNAVNSRLTEGAIGSSFKCLPAEPTSTLDAKKSITPEQMAYCEDAGIDLSECQGIDATPGTTADQ